MAAATGGIEAREIDVGPTGIYASTATRRQRVWGRRRRRATMFFRGRAGLLAVWAPAPVLAVMLAERWF